MGHWEAQVPRNDVYDYVVNNEKRSHLLPTAVAEWAGLGSVENVDIYVYKELSHLVELNDIKEFDFLRIADLIERQL